MTTAGSITADKSGRRKGKADKRQTGMYRKKREGKAVTDELARANFQACIA
jgi:hypothetical protein